MWFSPLLKNDLFTTEALSHREIFFHRNIHDIGYFLAPEWVIEGQLLILIS